MVDCFLVLMLARTGDELQGIKKGVLELADVIAVNKADGEHEQRGRARRPRARRRAAPDAAGRRDLDAAGADVQRRSNDRGLDEVWAAVERHRSTLDSVGELQARRRRQQVGWMWHLVDEQLRSSLRSDPHVRSVSADIEARVAAGTLPVTAAARQILAAATR